VSEEQKIEDDIMMVPVKIKKCGEDRLEHCTLCTRKMNVRWPGYLDTCLKWLLDGGATFAKSKFKFNEYHAEELQEIMSIQSRADLEERIKTLISDRDKSQKLLGEWSPIVHSKESTGGPSACKWCANKDLTCLSPSPNCNNPLFGPNPDKGEWVAWLIEDAGKKGSIRYMTMEQGMFEWTTDPLKALHFCRREDAERVAGECEDAWAIREHLFYGPLNPQCSGDHGGTTEEGATKDVKS
jgi:hypothetical protein